MTFIVNRDSTGAVSVTFNDNGVSVSLSGTPDTFTDELAPAPPEAAPAAAVVDAAVTLEETNDSVDVAAAPDNAQPFKCPACGATYPEQVDCTNQHPAEPTLPTEQVLSGEPPSAGSADGVTDSPAASSTGAAPTGEPPAEGAAADTAPPAPGPTWPTP